MLRLTNILEQISRKFYVYHVSETKVRNSIKKYGLDYSKYYDKENVSTSGKHVYVFSNLQEAVSYAISYNEFLKYQDEDVKEFDIWQIDAQGLKLQKDHTLNSDYKDKAYYIDGVIDRKRLKLIKTI